MARPGFSLDRKFKRLARALDDVQPGFGEILARGSLELLWDSAYEACDDYLGDSDDVEALAHWGGKAGTLTDALLEAGGEDRAGFIEEGGCATWPEGKPGTFRVHDLYDHAPDYVQKRLAREAAREKKGKSISDLRREAGKKGADTTHGKRPASVGQESGNWLANGGRLPQKDGQMDAAEVASGGQCPASVGQFARTPSPAPAPAPEEAHTLARASAGAGSELPGDGGGNRTVAKDDAARVDAAGGEEASPQRPDGGEEPRHPIAGSRAAAGRGAPDERRPDGTFPSTGRLSPLPRRDEMLDAQYPASAACFRLCSAGGWPVGYARDRVMRDSVEATIAMHRPDVVAQRLLAYAAGERAAGREPPPYSGWHQDVMQGLPPRPLARAAHERAQHDIRTGVAAPSPADAFQGGERELTR